MKYHNLIARHCSRKMKLEGGRTDIHAKNWAHQLIAYYFSLPDQWGGEEKEAPFTSQHIATASISREDIYAYARE